MTTDAVESSLEKPVVQLQLAHAELNRQRGVVQTRLGNMYTRAAILVAGAGVLSAVQSATFATRWQFVSVALSLAAAAFGLFTMRPIQGRDADARKNLEEMLRADPYSTEMYIYQQNRDGLSTDMGILDRYRKVVLRGYMLLTAAWGSAFLIGLLHSLQLI